MSVQLRLNVFGLVSAILAFLTIFLPWYSLIGINKSLLDIAIGTGSEISTEDILQWLALLSIMIGGVLGFLGSFVAGKIGKSFLMVGMILTLHSPMLYVVTLIGGGWLLFHPWAYMSIGFYVAFIAAFVMFISFVKHPKSSESHYLR